MRNIIRSVRSKSHEYNRHIAGITGVRIAPRPTYYKNTETGDEYYAIIGALAFSSHRTPGFAVIVSAIKDEQGPVDPKIEVLDEIEAIDGIDGLLEACKDRRRGPEDQRAVCAESTDRGKEQGVADGEADDSRQSDEAEIAGRGDGKRGESAEKWKGYQ